MRLSHLMEHYLRAHIDFSTFRLLGVFPQNKTDALVILVPRDIRETGYFNIQYKEHNHFFSNIENALEYCVHYKYLSRLTANWLIKKYHKQEGEK